MRLWLTILVALGLIACVDRDIATPEVAETVDATCDAKPQPVVVRKLDFVGLDEDGLTRGLDIDGRVSDRSDDESCNQADFSSPDGLEGIDNQFGKLLPALDVVGGREAVASAIQRAINTGSLLLVIEREEFRDEADECVQGVSITRASGVPAIGADGLIESGQTLERDLEAPIATMQQSLAPNGMHDAGVFSLDVPMQIDQFQLDVTIHSATLRFREQEDGSLRGIISGAIVVDEFLTIIEDIEDGTELLDVAAAALQRFADLDPDQEGECQQLSVTLEFEAAPIHLWQ